MKAVLRWLEWTPSQKKCLDAIGNEPTKLTEVPELVVEGAFGGSVGSDSVGSPIISGSPSESASAYGPGRPSPENAGRSVEDRLREARELLAWLSEFYDGGLIAFELEQGLPQQEARKRAME